MAPSCRNCRAKSKPQTNHKTRQNKPRTRTHNCDQKNPRNETIKHFGCGLCKKDHRLATCDKYLDMNLTHKYDTVIRLHYCENCLARNHLLTQCQSKARCNVCNRKHHSTLHGHRRVLEHNKPKPRTPSIGPNKSLASVSDRINPSGARQSYISCNIFRTVVPTALIKIQLEEGTKFARALLNSSANYTTIASNFVENLELKTFKMDDVTYTKLAFKATVPPYPKFEVTALVTAELPKAPYPESLPESMLDKFPRMELADPQFVSDNPVIVEIGADLHPAILKPNHMKAEGGLLMAMDSALGWLVIGSAMA